jgi:predicted nucleotide-binding protein
VNAIQELRLHADALANAVEQDSKFFAAVAEYVRRLKDLSTFPNSEVSPNEFKVIGERLQSFWYQWRAKDGWPGPRQTEDTKETVNEIVRLTQVLGVKEASEILSLYPQSRMAKQDLTGTAVFVGHGRSRLWARVQVYLEQEIGVKVVTFESETRVGESIVPILETMLAEAGLAVLILTAEDETAEGGIRARQNVIHEAGLFQGRLGFKRAVLLVQDGIEEFTNVAGLQYIAFSGDNIEETFYELQRVLKREQMV